MSSTYGTNFTLTLFGEEKGTAIGVIIEGIPCGTALHKEALERIAGEYKIISGSCNSRTSGTPLCALFPVEKAPETEPPASPDIVRPGFADLGQYVRSGGKLSLMNGGQNLATVQKPLLFAGAIAKQLLEQKGIYIAAHISALGGVEDQSMECVNLPDLLSALDNTQNFPVIDKRKEMLMKLAIAKKEPTGDTLGCKIEAGAFGLPAGVGAPAFDGMKSKLASSLFSLPYVTALEFGKGTLAADMCGSEYNDIPYVDPQQGKVLTHTNHAGGIESGLTTGMPVLLKATFAPSPVIAIEQQSIDRQDRRQAILPPFAKAQTAHAEQMCRLVSALMAITIIDSLN